MDDGSTSKHAKPLDLVATSPRCERTAICSPLLHTTYVYISWLFTSALSAPPVLLLLLLLLRRLDPLFFDLPLPDRDDPRCQLADLAVGVTPQVSDAHADAGRLEHLARARHCAQPAQHSENAITVCRAALESDQSGA